MDIINRIKRYIELRLAHRNSQAYIKYLRKKGVKIGENFYISGGTRDKNIDLSRPSLITIGDNVSINKNFTLMTHDFVSGVFLFKFKDFLPSSGKVVIGNNVRFGVNCTVLKGVTIGDNCFIGANSVVSSNIPSNSIASGNPCQVQCSIETYYKYRQEASKYEAFIYAQSIIERFKRLPKPADFWEEFPLFVDKSNIDNYPEIPVRRQLKTSYNEWIKTHKAQFPNFEDFLKTALDYSPSINKNSDKIKSKEIPFALLDEVRTLVNKCTGNHLLSEDDCTNMEKIDGWSSLSNLIIQSEIEKKYDISLDENDLFNMVSIYTIAETIYRKKKKSIFPINLTELYPHSKLLSDICKNVECHPFKTALKIQDISISYRSLYENVCKTANFLSRLNIKYEDRVIISAQKRIEYIYVYLACHILGVVSVILDPESSLERTKYIEKKTSPKFCFGYLSESVTSCLYDEIRLDDIEMLSQSTNAKDIKETDISEILFTTGTTGNPKGVCLSYANVYGSASNINKFIKNTFDDIELIALPLCHSFAMGRLRCNLINGGTIVLVEGYANVQRFINTIETEKITGFGIVPAAWNYLRKVGGNRISTISSQIKYIEIGSASMSLEEKKEILSLFPHSRICMHYGLTEASRSSFIEFHDAQHLSSIGKPVTDEVLIKIFDKNGKEVPVGEIGELCVCGNMVLSRYLDESDNNNAFWDKYLRTGDNGYLGADGYLYLLGREKEMINVGGKKVSPMEVEDIICSIGVGDCICVAMNDPKGILGEVVKCYILKGSTKLSFVQISSAVCSKLEEYKRPVVYDWIDSIPKTASGKKQRFNL